VAVHLGLEHVAPDAQGSGSRLGGQIESAARRRLAGPA